MSDDTKEPWLPEPPPEDERGTTVPFVETVEQMPPLRHEHEWGEWSRKTRGNAKRRYCHCGAFQERQEEDE